MSAEEMSRVRRSPKLNILIFLRSILNILCVVKTAVIWKNITVCFLTLHLCARSAEPRVHGYRKNNQTSRRRADPILSPHRAHRSVNGVSGTSRSNRLVCRGEFKEPCAYESFICNGSRNSSCFDREPVPSLHAMPERTLFAAAPPIPFEQSSNNRIRLT